MIYLVWWYIQPLESSFAKSGLASVYPDAAKKHLVSYIGDPLFFASSLPHGYLYTWNQVLSVILSKISYSCEPDLAKHFEFSGRLIFFPKWNHQWCIIF